MNSTSFIYSKPTVLYWILSIILFKIHFNILFIDINLIDNIQ